jgi:hypothetical protein
LSPIYEETFKDIIKVHEHLRPSKDALVAELRKLFQTMRDGRKYAEVDRLVEMAQSSSTPTASRKAAFIILCNGRENFKLVKEAPQWEDPEAMENFAAKYEPLIMEALQEAYEDDEEVEKMMEINILERKEYGEKKREEEKKKRGSKRIRAGKEKKN